MPHCPREHLVTVQQDVLAACRQALRFGQLREQRLGRVSGRSGRMSMYRDHMFSLCSLAAAAGLWWVFWLRAGGGVSIPSRTAASAGRRAWQVLV